MTIETFFQQWEAAGHLFPARGQVLQYRRRQTETWYEGRCDFCFVGIEPTVALEDGAGYLFPTLGDEWRPADDLWTVAVALRRRGGRGAGGVGGGGGGGGTRS